MQRKKQKMSEEMDDSSSLNARDKEVIVDVLHTEQSLTMSPPPALIKNQTQSSPVANEMQEDDEMSFKV